MNTSTISFKMFSHIMTSSSMTVLLLMISVTSVSSRYNPLEDDSTDLGCLDHSDCTVLGYKFGCLVYKCVDHDLVTPCDDQLQCPDQGLQCIR